MGRAALAALLLIALQPAAPAGAAGASFSIERFAVAMEIHPDASLSVQESLTIAFRGNHRGIFRTIPVQDMRHGIDFSLRIGQIHVLDDDHQPLKREVSHPGRYVKIKAWVPGAVDTRKTIHILYRVERALVAHDDRDELYWNVTGTEWDVPIGEAEATVRLPAALRGVMLQTVAFTGPRGGVGRDWHEERVDEGIVFRTTRRLAAREGLTIAVAWPAGVIHRPSATREAWWFVVDNWPLTLPMLTLAAMILVWSAYGRDPAIHRSIKPEYEPPAGLTPAQAGTLLDERMDPRDAVATLVDLAVRGYMEIERLPDDRDFLFRRLKPLAGDSTLRPVERLILQRVFGEELSLREHRLSELRRNSHYVFTPMRDAVESTMVRDRLLAASPFWIRQGWGALGIAVLIVAVWIGVFAPDHRWTLAGGVGLSSFVIMGFSHIMPRRTLRGARALAQVRGFQEFLERAEKDRLERLPPDTLHRWLPWAIALGVTERWIHNWDGLKVDAPTWYAAREPFALADYWREVDTFGRQHEEALFSTRRAGGDSWGGGSAFGGGGDSGGGSSGGGAGGGGGGTF